MRIAQIAPLFERTPPKKYGGTERVVYTLTEQLVKRGHDVTLFATGDSVTSAKLVSLYPTGLREAKLKEPEVTTLTLLNIGLAFSHHNDFDVIHDHNGYFSISTANMSVRPSLVTLHGYISPQERRLFQYLSKPYLASISKSQSTSVSRLGNFAGVVYNGLDMKQYPFSEETDGYLLYVGRISMEKGVHYAIQAAQYLNIPLIIAAKLDNVDVKYYHEYVKPLLSGNVKWVGEVDEEERNRLMSKALCFLHPVTWKEPFGLTLIEAMACGCPVIAFNKGSIPEIVVNGKTGFVVSDVEEMIDAIQNVSTIERAECRRHALSEFSAEKMTDGYEEIYRRLINMPEQKTAA